MFLYQNCSSQLTVKPSDSAIQSTVDLKQGPIPCAGFEGQLNNIKCYRLAISCEGVPLRYVEIREATKPGVVSPSANMITFTGGPGVAFYGDTGTLPRSNILSVLEAGLKSFEVRWAGENGWATNAEGWGYKKIMCAPTKVVQWIRKNLAAPGVPTCAAGGSGGAKQISYGLAVYGLERELDMALLGSGPPIARIDKACFDIYDATKLDTMALPPQFGGRSLTDKAMGWSGKGDYCFRASSTADVILRAQQDSLVSPLSSESRDFHYPNTKINFVLSYSDPTSAHINGKHYMDQITSAKALHIVNEPVHDIGQTEAGSEIIKNVMLECR